MKQLNEIAKLYNLTKPIIKPLNIRSVNKTFKIECEEGDFFIKQIYKLKGFNVKNILGQIDIANHLNKKGTKTFIPLKNKKGEQLSRIGEEYFLVYKFIKLDDYKEFTEEHMEIAIKELAKFHNAMKDFKTKNTLKENQLQKDIDSITTFTETAFNFRTESVINLAKKTQNKFAKQILNDAPLIKESIIRAIHYTWNKFSNKQTILHYDFGPHNIFFSNGEFVAIGDFDFSHKGSIEVDVAKAARFWATNKNNKIDITKYKRFIYLYNKENKIKLDWNYYYGLLIFLTLRRLVYSASYTLGGKKDISFLYDKDIKTIEFLMKNKL